MAHFDFQRGPDTKWSVNQDFPGARLHLTSPKGRLMKEKRPHSDSAKAHLRKGSYKKNSCFVFRGSNPALLLTPLGLQQRNQEKSCQENSVSPQLITLFFQGSIFHVKNWGRTGQGVNFYTGLDLSISVGAIQSFPTAASFSESVGQLGLKDTVICVSCFLVVAHCLPPNSPQLMLGQATEKKGTADVKSIQLSTQSLLLFTSTPGSCFGPGSRSSLN